MGEGAQITIEDLVPAHGRIYVGLSVETGSPPLTVGCSIRASGGEEFDLPTRVLVRGGLIWWGPIDLPDACRDENGWSGEVMYALYTDDSLTKRLADTGWQPWTAPSLLGSRLGLAVGLDGFEFVADSMSKRYGNAAPWIN